MTSVVIGFLIWAVILGFMAEKPEVIDENPFEGWNISGPFAVNKFEYKLGENVFLTVGELKPYEGGKIQIISPVGKWYDIPFNGTLKANFNQYFKPDLFALIGHCTRDDIIGEWTLNFVGVPYQPIKFKMLNETLAGLEEHYAKNVCRTDVPLTG